MLAGGEFIHRMIREGIWKFYRYGSPGFPNKEIGPNSIDVTLAPTIAIPRKRASAIDLRKGDESIDWDWLQFSAINPFTLRAGQFVLAATIERVNCSCETEFGYFAPMYEGRSTLARLGIGSHVTAGFGDYGFDGTWTLELVNHSPNDVTFPPGLRIGQVYFVQVVEPRLYQGAYNTQYDPRPVAPVIGKGRF